MTEPFVLSIFLRSIKTKRITAHIIRASGLCKDAFHGLFLQYADTIIAHTKIHQHLVELQLVVGCCPKACSGRSKDMAIVVGTLLPAVFQTIHSWLAFLDIVHLNLGLQLLVGRPKPGRFHAKRVEHFLLQIVLPLHARNNLHDSTANVNARVGIHISCAWFKHNGRAGCDTGHLTKRRASRPASAANIRAFCTTFKGETACMVEHHTNRQHVLCFVERLDTILVAVLHPKFLELRQILRHRVVQRELTLLDEFRDGHTAEALRLRTLHKDIVEADGTFLLNVCITDATRLLHAIIVEDADCTREFASVNIRLQSLTGKGRL